MPTTRTSAPELKFTALDLKQVEPDGTFAGYASLFDTEDMGHDIVLPGAFRDSLRQRGAAGIKMLFQHKPDEPIGIWETLKEDARGLFAKGRLMLDVARAREVLALMRAGALDGLSIGFRAVTGRRDAKTGIRRLAKVDLWEISVVTFPLLTRGARRPRQGAPLRAAAHQQNENSNAGSRRTLGSRARRHERSSATATRASSRRTLLEAPTRNAASSPRSRRPRGSCATPPATPLSA